MTSQYAETQCKSRRVPAIVVGGPFGAVKEQSSGLYAQTMAERGFVTLAFDIAEISPRPVLFVHGENAHSLYFAETAYEAAAEPKELVIIPGASHTDLYDQMDLIPFDKLQASFEEHLSAWLSVETPVFKARASCPHRHLKWTAHAALGTGICLRKAVAAPVVQQALKGVQW